MVENLIREKIIAILRSRSESETLMQTKACIDGGINVIELTFSIPEVCNILPNLKKKYPDKLFGIGSVVNARQTVEAIDAGADFIVSPGYSSIVNEICQQENKLYIPGVMTVSEIIYAREIGIKLLKLFPGNQLTPEYVRSILAPLPDLNLMITGGVDIDNVGDWFNAGVKIVGIGSNLTESKTEETISSLAKEYKEKIL